MDWLAVLGEYCDNITFGEIKGEASNVDVSRVPVVGMPGSFGGAVVLVRDRSGGVESKGLYTAFSSSSLLRFWVWRMAFMLGTQIFSCYIL